MKTCPNCGGNKFKAHIKKGAVIEITENEVITLKEGNKFSYEISGCLSCKAELTNDDLIEAAVPCTKCKKDFTPDELKDGLCPLCSALQERPELAKATKEDLLLKLLEVERQLGMTSSAKINVKVEKAEHAKASVDAKEAAVTEETDSSEKEPHSKSKKRAKAKPAEETEQPKPEPEPESEAESEKKTIDTEEQEKESEQNSITSDTGSDEEIVDPFGPNDEDDKDDDDDDDVVEPNFSLGDEPF